MIVRNIMIENVMTASPTDNVKSVYDQMKLKMFDAVPVTEGKSVVGVLRLRHIYEKVMEVGRDATFALTVGDLMLRHALTIAPEAIIEKAAKLMWAKDVPLLPVVDDGNLVGIINEADIAKAFAELLGADTPTSRITLVVPDRKGQIARIAEIIRDAGISIRSIACMEFKPMHQYRIIVRVDTDEPRPLVEKLGHMGYKTIEVHSA